MNANDKLVEALENYCDACRVDDEAASQICIRAILSNHQASLIAEPTVAPASLIEEVKDYADKQYQAENGMWCPKLEQDLTEMASRYTPKPPVSDMAGLVKELQEIEVLMGNCSINGISKEINDLLWIAAQKCKLVIQNVMNGQILGSQTLREIWGPIYQRLLSGGVSYKELEAIRKVMDEILSKYPTAPTPKPTDVEPLAVLADRKNCYFTVLCHKGEWDIQIYSHEDDSDEPLKFCDGFTTYAAAEQAARSWLETLEDKGERK